MDIRFQKTPDEYVESIDEYSRRSQDDYLLSGVHYKHIAELLQTAASSNNGHLMPSNQHTYSKSSFRDVVVVDLLHDSNDDGKDTMMTRELSTPQEYLKGRQIDLECSQLVFLRGYLPAEWIKELGANLRVDPEFWRRHLTFLQLQDFYDLPPLPSSTHRHVQLRITTIFNRKKATSRKAVEKTRLDTVKYLTRHYRHLKQANSLGESIIRRLDMHDEAVFTVEQYISCSIVNKNNGWAVLIWLDTGKPLPSDVTDSWIEGHTGGTDYAKCLPTIQNPPEAAFSQARANDRTINTPTSSSSNKTYQPMVVQSSALLPLQYGMNLDVSSMRLAPLYALSDVFRLAACSSNQYNGLLRSRVDEALRNAPLDEALCLDDLRFSKRILDDYLDYLQEIIAFLEIGYSSWMLSNFSRDGSNNNEMLEKLTTKTQEEFLRDFRCIQRRMQTLATHCIEGTNIILNGAMLRESQKGIDQAEEVKLITKIAFIYAPLSFACSVCGMQYFPQSTPIGVGVFFAILVVAFMLSGAHWYSISDSIAAKSRKQRLQRSKEL